MLRSLLIDLIKDENDTMEGLAYATHVPIDVLHDIVYGINTNPSVGVSTSIIGYYIVVKRREYTELIRKVFQWVEYSGVHYKSS